MGMALAWKGVRLLEPVRREPELGGTYMARHAVAVLLILFALLQSGCCWWPYHHHCCKPPEPVTVPAVAVPVEAPLR